MLGLNPLVVKITHLDSFPCPIFLLPASAGPRPASRSAGRWSDLMVEPRKSRSRLPAALHGARPGRIAALREPVEKYARRGPWGLYL